MTDIINITVALISIGLGGFGWLIPGYTMRALDLTANGSTMGISEIRASAGALFVGLGVGALILADPVAYAVMGFAWGGAALGRFTSILLDGAPSRQKIAFFAIEAVVAALLLWLNIGR